LVYPNRLSDIESFFVYVYFSIFYRKIKKRGFDWYLKKKKGGRIFIFGSGASLNELSNSDWEKIRSSGSTMSFNEFYYSNFINLDYYIFREVESKSFLQLPVVLRRRLNSIFNFKKMQEIFSIISNNPRMENTKQLFLCDRKSGISLLYLMKYYKHINLLGLFSNPYDRTINWPISQTSKNISHGAATLLDAVNIAYLLGYDEIVLAGVDLYDRAYFFLKPDETREFDKKKGFSAADSHNTAKHIINTLELWKNKLSEEGVKIKILNKESLLNVLFPIYEIH